MGTREWLLVPSPLIFGNVVTMGLCLTLLWKTFILCTDGTGSRYATVLRTTLRTMVNLSKLVSFLTHLEVETILLGCRLDLSSDFNMVRHIAQQPRLNFGRFALLQSYSPAFSFYSIVAYHKFHIWSTSRQGFLFGIFRWQIEVHILGVDRWHTQFTSSQVANAKTTVFQLLWLGKGSQVQLGLVTFVVFWVPYSNQQGQYSH